MSVHCKCSRQREERLDVFEDLGEGGICAGEERGDKGEVEEGGVERREHEVAEVGEGEEFGCWGCQGGLECEEEELGNVVEALEGLALEGRRGEIIYLEVIQHGIAAEDFGDKVLELFSELFLGHGGYICLRSALHPETRTRRDPLNG